MKRIRLSGKYAVGPHRFTLVDDDQFRELNKYKWKAKPSGSGSNMYAIRTTLINERTKDVRMHREVLGVDYDGVLDIDHINRDSLDNRRRNLRLCTRSQNCKNSIKNVRHLAEVRGRRPKLWLCQPHTSKVYFGLCNECGKAFMDRTGRKQHCSDACRYTHKNKVKRLPKGQAACAECNEIFTTLRCDQTYCSRHCREAAYNRSRRKAGK